MSDSRSASWRAAFGTLLLLVAGITIAIALAEATLRALDPFPQRLHGDRIVLPQSIRYFIENDHNPRLDQRVVHTKNSLGFRGPELPWNGSALTLFAVGGSTTECFYLGDGDDWPSRLMGHLSTSFPTLWVNNAGLDGHSTFGHRVLLEQRLLRHRPDVLIFLIGANDIGREDVDARRIEDMARARRKRGAATTLTRLARHSAVFALVQNARRTFEAKSRGLSHEALDLGRVGALPHRQAAVNRLISGHRARYLPAFRQRLDDLVSLSRSNGALPVLVTQPALFGPAVDDVTGVDLGTIAIGEQFWSVGRRWNGSMGWEMYETYNDVTRETARDRNVPLIDLASSLPKSSRLFYDTIHFTSEGAREVARIVAESLCPILAGHFPDRARGPCEPAR